MIFTTAAFITLFGYHVSASYTSEALADQVTNLPGAENLDITFNQFSGYLTVDNTKQMHYWFVESMNDPANDPISFWTNGHHKLLQFSNYLQVALAAVDYSDL